MRNRTVCVWLILIVVSCVLISCEAPWGATRSYFFEIHNNSDISIRYGVYKNYPDTLVPDSTSLNFRRLDPKDVGDYDSRDKWPKYFSKLPADTLSIFFISQDSISKYGWKQIQSRYLILARKDISLKDLEDSDYTITYP